MTTGTNRGPARGVAPSPVRGMTRAEVLRRASMFGLGAAALPLLQACGGESDSTGGGGGGGTTTLNYFSWEPWARPEFVKPFEEEHDVSITSAYYSSGAEMLTKLQGGGSEIYDMLSPVNNDITQLVAGDLTIPFDLSKIPNYDKLLPAYQNHPDVVIDGEHYMIPFVWGTDTVAYNRDRISDDEANTWDVLFNPKFKGRLAVQDSAFQTIALTAISLGYTDPSPFDLTDAQLEDCKKKCIEAKPLWRTIWSNFTDLQNLFITEEVWASQAWLVVLPPVREEGIDMGWAFVKEGSIGWFEGLTMVKGTEHEELLHEYANWCIGEQFMYDVYKGTGYYPCSTAAGENMTEEELADSRLAEPELPNSQHYYKNPPNFAKWQEVWAEIKAA